MTKRVLEGQLLALVLKGNNILLVETYPALYLMNNVTFKLTTDALLLPQLQKSLRFSIMLRKGGAVWEMAIFKGGGRQ